MVDNFVFEACGYMNDEKEFNHWKNMQDGRPKRWFIYPDVLKFAR